MCGIGGIISFDPARPVRREALAAMAITLAHRGPDAESIWFTQEAGFAFRRLAVLDPDPRAMQPMTSPDGRYIIAFNGEIYNFRDLKKRLKKQDWRTRGDTEVLLHALIEWGPAALTMLSGMFAIALWDTHDRTLLLARDAMGQKPLYYAAAGNSVVFASEPPALFAWGGWDDSVNGSALAEYLRFSYINAPQTIYRGARQLEPGTYLQISPAGMVGDAISPPPVRWFDCNNPAAESPDDAKRDLRGLIESAVEEQLVSDVPLGVFLSGGIDSSIIALCARRHGAVRTFAIAFDDMRYDESRYAREVAEYLGTKHHEFRVTPNAALELPRLATLFGEPFGDSSALPVNDLARETRKHVTVALSGDGGDELFGGYDRYRAMAMNLRVLRVFGPIGKMLAGRHPKSHLSRAGRLIRAAGLEEGERYRQIVGLFDEEWMRSLLGGETLSPPNEYLDRWRELRRARSRAETALAVDRLTYLPGDLLTKTDRCTMRHNLEVRSPFMDHRLIRRAATLKNPDLFRGGKKRLLREAFAKDLPASVFGRRKMGFAVPIGEWFRGALRPMLRDHLLAKTGFCWNHLGRPGVERLLDEHDRLAADHTQRLYALLMLELWWQTKPTLAAKS